MLGRNRSAFIGREDYVLEANGRWRGEVSPVTSLVPANPPGDDASTKKLSYSSRLSQRLEEKAERYYKQGIAYFREGRFPRSRGYFQLVRQLESDRPRGYIANVIVSLQGSDINTAVTSLVRAIDRAQSLDDLRVDWREFYAKEQDFQQIVNSVNVLAKSGAGVDRVMSLMLAYYSFLNGDLNTAIAAAKMAEEQSTSGISTRVGSSKDRGTRREEPFTAAARRFGELLTAARDQGGTPNGSSVE